MTRPRGPAYAPRRVGFALAGVMALVFAAIIGYYVLSAPSSDPSERPPPDITDIPVLGGDPAGAGSGIVIQLAAKDNPSKQVGELRAERYEPLENRRALLERPQAFYFLDNGRTIYIRSDTARVFRPTEQSQPESGTFEGNGLAQVFDPTPDGSRIDPRTHTPAATARFNSMSFDTTLGELATDDTVDFESAQATGFVHGLRVYIDEVARTPRLMEVFRGGRVEYLRPEADEPQAPAPAPPPAASRPEGAPPAPRPAAAPAAPIRPPVETRYHAIFSGGVNVEQGTRAVASQALDVWARLRDNKLPPNAIAPLDAPVKQGSGPPAPPPSAKPRTPAVPSPHEPASSVAATPQPPERRASPPPVPAPGTAAEPVPAIATEEPPDEPIILTWDGSLIIRPLDEQPNELRRDHVTLRFRSDPDRGVRYADAVSGETAHCRAFTYFATTRRAAAQGSGPGTVTYDAPNVGAIAAGEVRADLATGLVTVPTPGIVNDPASGRTIAWAEKASVELERGPSGNSTVRRATFEGDVHAADGQSALRGGFLMADFATDEVSDGERTWLRKVLIDEAAHAERVGEGSISGDRLEAWFDPGEDGDAVPTFVVATGNVVGEEGPRGVTAGVLEATLRRTPAGDIEVTQALARGGVNYREESPGRPKMEAFAEEVKADPVARVVDLFGPEAEENEGAGSRHEEPGVAEESSPPAPGRDRGRGSARIASGATAITGSQMRLDEAARRIWVFGAGRFDHQESPREDGARPRTVAATWTEEMTFDDLAGVVTAFGDVESVSGDALNDETLRGHALRIEITPLMSGLVVDPTAISRIDDPEPMVEVPMLAAEAKERKLRRAIVTGTILDHEGGRNARVESRLYFPDAGEGSERRVERILYLEGPRLIADDDGGFLDVPGAGRMLVLNRGEGGDAAAAPGAPELGGRASSLFDWTGRMRMDRASGRIEMHEGVGVTHRLLDDGRTLVLECAHLVAHVREQPGASGTASPETIRGELVSATATGSVFAKSATREVVCGRFEYDATTGIAEAFGAAGEPILYTDTSLATASMAQSLRWDLKQDRIELRGVGTIVAPR